MDAAGSGEQIPVLVVFSKRPSNQYDLQSMSGADAKQELKSLAQRQQERAKTYLQQQRERNRASQARTLWSTNSLAVRATPGTVRELAKLPNVEAIVYDRQVTPASSELEPFSSILSKYGNTTAPAGFESDTTGERAWGIDYIGADAVQERGVTGAGVNVSIVDTGIDGGHPALDGSVIRWKDFTADDYQTPTDPDGHGTHVAGTVSGSRNASEAVGVAPESSLFGAKVFSENPQEPSRISDLITAFEWSANNSADVISASVGVPPIYENFEGQTSTGGDNVGSSDVRVRVDGDNFSENLSAEAYKPAYIMVAVEPVAVDGQEIQNDSTRRAVMANLSVSLKDPNGQETLEAVDASWAYYDGEVPAEIVFRKYKPSDSEPITADGNWSLEVTSETGQNVTYEYVASPVYPTNGSDELAESVNTISTTHDVVSVIAAGNYGYIFGNRTVSSPGAAAEAVTVGASGWETNDVATFSSRGPVGYGADERPGVDILAPGVDILSTYPTDLTPSDGSPYAWSSGTSMATPHVSGTIALMLEAEPALSPGDVKGTLDATAQDVPGGDNAVGAGVVDAYKAVEMSNASALGNESTEQGRHTLFAGLADTEETDLWVEVEPHTDPDGDAGSAPDIWQVSTFVRDNFEIATHDEASPNATFRLYIDADRSDSTGDASGSDYMVMMNRSYDGTVYSMDATEFAYDSESGSFTSTSDLYVGTGSVNARFIEIFGIHFETRSNTQPFDWHLTTEAEDGSPGDRYPNAGQTVSGVEDSVINGTAVAWNASAGAPDADTPITFTLYNESGIVVSNETVRSDADGHAETSIHVDSVQEWEDYTLEITDVYGNDIRQEVTYSGACIEGCLIETSEINATVKDRWYSVQPNETVELNIPVYTEENGEISPYTGSASLELRNWQNGESVYINDIQVDDGVVRTTVDLSATTVDDLGSHVSIRVALESDFQNASATTHGGYLRLMTDASRANFGPFSTVVSEGESATLSFQQVNTADDTPVNESVSWTTLWVTDRNVASLYGDLPRETRQRLQERKQNVQAGTTEPMAAQHRNELREAFQNISRQGASYPTTNGTATPTAHGMGTFQVAQPKDARFGIVMQRTEDGLSWYGASIIFVEDRVSQYADRPTEPSERTNYELDVYADWDSHVEGDYRVPAENMTVTVELRNESSWERVDNATVKLYTTFGDPVTVRTNGSREVTATIPVPDLDWRNLSWEFHEQEVLGVAVGYSTAEGGPVTDTSREWANAYRVRSGENVTEPVPWLSYNQGTLTTRIDYENETGYDVAGEKTLVTLSTERNWDSHRDIFVGYVNPGSQTEITFNVTDPQPPAPDEPREYRIDADTANIPWTWVDSEYVSGFDATVDAPHSLTDEATATVHVTVTDRNDQPVTDGVVRWQYTLHEDSGKLETTGGTQLARTNATGVATFEVSADIAESINNGWVEYEIGVATANTSQTRVESGSIEVTQTDISVSGGFENPDGSAATDDFVALWGTGAGGTDRTDTTGSFDIQVEGNNAYDLQHHAIGGDGEFLPRDGVVDLYAADRVEVNESNKAVGTYTLPVGHVLDVEVVDENGNPVENASVTVSHINNGADAGWIDRTDANGMLNSTAGPTTGIEVNGSVYIEVEPPEGDTRFRDVTAWRNITVSSDRTVTVTLNDTIVTATGQINEADGTPAANDAVVFFSDEAPFKLVHTDSTGAYSADLEEGATYEMMYYQGNASLGSTGDLPRDGSVDFTHLRNISITSDSNFGTDTVPVGHTLNVTVVDESGDPVENATVNVLTPNHHGLGAVLTNPNGMLSGAWTSQHRQDGFENTEVPPGVEVNGTTVVEVTPPEGADRFTGSVQMQYTVTADQNVVIPLDERPTISGRIIYPDGSTHANDTLANFGSESVDSYFATAVTAEDGSFRMLTVEAGDVDVQFYQANWSNNVTPASVARDGVVDMYAIERVNTTSGPVDIGDATVPNGHVVNVTVIDEDGNPVEDATVDIGHTNGNATAGLISYTNSDGKLELGQHNGDMVGMELNGTVNITVTPPNGSALYTDETYYRNLTVTGPEDLTVTLNETGANETTVSLAPSSATTALNGTHTYDIVVNNVSGGVGAIEGSVTLDNASVASITDVTVKGGAGLTNVNISDDGSTVTFDGALMDTADTGSVVVATVTVQGDVEGTTGVSLGIDALGTEDGSSYAVAGTTDAELTVKGIQKLRESYNGPPTDTDGDGVYEDINGDGEFNIVDIQALYTVRDTATVQNNAAMFDINGNGEVDIVDVQALYAELGDA